MNVVYLTIFVLNTLFHFEKINAKYLLVNINENTTESFRKANNEDRKSLIINSFRAPNWGINKGNPSKGESRKGEHSKRKLGSYLKHYCLIV